MASSDFLGGGVQVSSDFPILNSYGILWALNVHNSLVLNKARKQNSGF